MNNHFHTAFALAVAVLGSSGLAHGDDVVHLKNGGRFRGVVMEEQPGQGVTLRLADGTVKSIPTDEVKVVDYGQTLPASTPPTPAEGRGAPAESLTPAPVTLKSDSPGITLDEILSQGAYAGGAATAHGYTSVAMFGSTWRTRCTVPCGERLSLNAQYRIGGAGVQPSSAFVLPHTKRPLTLQVHAGSDAGYAWGRVLTFTAVGFLVAGGTLLAIGLADSQDKADASIASSGARVGAGGLIAGAVLLIPGIILWASNGTSVQTKEGRELAKARPGLGARGLVF